MTSACHSDYKVYVHQKADDGTIFYVGKGRRWRENERSNRNKHWHNVVNKHGFTVHIVASNLTNKDACAFERLLIGKLGRDSLVNYTNGGEGSEGYKHTEQAVQKMRQRKLSIAHKEKLSLRKLEKPSRYWLGKNRDQETVRKIKEKLTDPMHDVVKEMLLRNVDRKTISKQTGKSSNYIRGLASRMRKLGYEIERLQN